MKFLRIATCASLALAAPAPQQAQVQNTGSVASAPATLLNTVSVLDGAVKANVNAITQAAQALQGSDADLTAVTNTLRASFQNLAAGFQQAGNTVLSVTTGSFGGIVGQSSGLLQSEINELSSAVRQTIAILNNLAQGLRVGQEQLPENLREVIHSQVDAVKHAISPFLTPMVTYAIASRTSNPNLQENDLGQGIQQLVSVMQDFLTSLGLPIIGIPSVPGLPGVLGVPGIKIVL